MNVTVRRKALLAALNQLDGVAKVGNPSIVGHILVTPISATEIILTVTDMLTTMAIALSVDLVSGDDEAVIPFEKLQQILKECSGDVLDLVTTQEKKTFNRQRSIPAEEKGGEPTIEKYTETLDVGRFVVRFGRKIDYDFHTTHKVAEFPVVRCQGEKAKRVAGVALAGMLSATVSAVDKSSNRGWSGVLLDIGEADIVAVGTDGKRLSKMSVPASGDLIDNNRTLILSHRDAKTIADAVADKAECVVNEQAGRLMVIAGNVSIICRLQEGKYPDYRAQLERRGDEGYKCVRVKCSDLARAVRQAAVITNAESRGILFVVDDGKVVLSAEAAEVGRAKIDVSVSDQNEARAGGSFELDHKFVGQALEAIGSDGDVELTFNNADLPVFFNRDGNRDYEAVIMPMAAQ